MAIPTLGDFLGQAKGLYEPQRKYNFNLEFFLPAQRDAEMISLAVETCSLPTESHNRIELNYGNVKRYVAGKASYDNMAVTCKDFVNAGTMQSLIAWSQKVYNPVTDQVGFASGYKTLGTLVLAGPDGTSERFLDLVGVFIDSIKTADLSVADNNINFITVNFSVDKVIPRVVPQITVSIPLPSA